MDAVETKSIFSQLVLYMGGVYIFIGEANKKCKNYFDLFVIENPWH